MTKLFINSTIPTFANRIKPEVFEKIEQRRKNVKEQLNKAIAPHDTITLEIGCGHGHFLTAYGQMFESEKIIGIDVNRGRIYKALKKVDRADLHNVYFIEAESMELLALLPDFIRIAKTWILFPDPWPKKRHFKNRIIQKSFLEQLAQKTCPSGKLFLRSDYEPFMDWSRELIEASSRWQLTDAYSWPEVTTTVFQELTNNRHQSLVAELQPTEQ